jgi:hypothetical protein
VTSSCDRCFGFATGLVPIGFQSSSFLVGLAWSILWICPSHLILCGIMYVVVRTPYLIWYMGSYYYQLHVSASI